MGVVIADAIAAIAVKAPEVGEYLFKEPQMLPFGRRNALGYLYIFAIRKRVLFEGSNHIVFIKHNFYCVLKNDLRRQNRTGPAYAGNVIPCSVAKIRFA